MDMAAKVKPVVVQKQRRNFYDGGEPASEGVPEVSPDPDVDVMVRLDRRYGPDESGRNREHFILERRIAYHDRHRGEIVVPPVYKDFRTDLTSVPPIFGWLVPRTGAHLPAALIHDALVTDPGQAAPHYTTEDGKPIDRVEADRVFRDGMADTGTGLVRRWLLWSAVTLATMWSMDGTSPSAFRRQYYRWALAAVLWSIVWLSYVSTADLLDRTESWWGAYDVRWVSEGSLLAALVTGAAGAVVIPALLALLWGPRFWRAGLIAGVAIALVLHVTVALAVVTGVYWLLEAGAKRLNAMALAVVSAAVLLGAGVVFVIAVAGG